jgi:hypothetical protein
MDTNEPDTRGVEPISDGVFMVGDTYEAWCPCGWSGIDVETVESAGHLLDLHRGDEHFDD